MPSRATVVCIEDEPEMIDLMRFILEREGYRFVEAHGGEEGLRRIREEKPDLVLLDLMMADLGGWEVYRHLQADQAFEAVPVIVVTAKAEKIDRVLGLQIAQVADYIVKPFGAQELLESVDRVLGEGGPEHS